MSNPIATSPEYPVLPVHMKGGDTGRVQSCLEVAEDMCQVATFAALEYDRQAKLRGEAYGQVTLVIFHGRLCHHE